MDTRSEQLYRKAWSDADTETTGIPITITFLDNNTVIKVEIGPPIVSGLCQPKDFYDYLDKWGRTWMWEILHLDETLHNDLLWPIHAIENDTAIWVTDGSHVIENEGQQLAVQGG